METASRTLQNRQKTIRTVGRARNPAAVLKGAIARLTRTLLTAPDGAIPGLVAERAVLRAELQELTDDAMMRVDDERTR